MELRALRATSRERDPRPVPPAPLPATARTSPPSSPSQKLVSLNSPCLMTPEKGRASWAEPHPETIPPFFPVSNYVCEQPGKNTTFKLRTKLWPKQPFGKSNKWEARKTARNYSESSRKESCSESSESPSLRISCCGRTLPKSCCILLERVRSPWKLSKGF